MELYINKLLLLTLSAIILKYWDSFAKLRIAFRVSKCLENKAVTMFLDV